MINENTYFNGKVKSLGFQSEHGRATIGVMDPGEYEFGTSQRELMTILSGECFARLPGEADFISFPAGEYFSVEAGQKFQIKMSEQVAYLCLYS